MTHRVCVNALLYPTCGWCERVMWPWQPKVHGPIHGYPIDHAACHDARLAAGVLVGPSARARNYC